MELQLTGQKIPTGNTPEKGNQKGKSSEAKRLKGKSSPGRVSNGDKMAIALGFFL